MIGNILEIVEFSQRNPWRPKFSESQVKRFLTELISSDELIFDLNDANGRVATAVLIDRVNNPSNDACLEILGMRKDADFKEVIGLFIETAKLKTPKNRSGFQMGYSEAFPFSEEVLIQNHLVHYYDTYEMTSETSKQLVSTNQSEIIDAHLGDCDEVYKVLCESFSQNPDTSIPDEEAWRNGFLKSKKSHFFLWKTNGRILGFATLVEGDDKTETEIRTIGVLPTARGKGIGRALLQHCLVKTKSLGFERSHLTVAVKNIRALDLYVQAGFKIIEKYQCYRMSLEK